jgi:hypothetical protein|nr:hypothetical protein [uncultured Flavobacterium sp.]
MKTNNLYRRSLNRIFILVFLLGFNFMQSQTGFDDDVQDVPAPIDDYVWILLVLGVTYVFWKLKRLNANQI